MRIRKKESKVEQRKEKKFLNKEADKSSWQFLKCYDMTQHFHS